MYRLTKSPDPPDRAGAPQTATAPARLSQKEAARLYDRLAAIYDLWGHLAETRARQRALDLAAVRNGDRVLEVAVGTGLAFAGVVAANPDGRNLGLDISSGMLARARRRLRGADARSYTLCRASALQIPAPAASFDVVLNNYMFDLLDTDVWPTVLGEFRRVLRPDGRLVLANMTRGERWGSGIYQRLYDVSPQLIGGCRGVMLSGPLAAHGFEIRRREYFQQMLFPSEVILATPRGEV